MNSPPNELVKQNSFDVVRDNGNHLIETNEFFKDLSELDKRINIFLLWKIMRNKDTNKFAIQTVLKKLENPNNSIFDELKEFMELNDNSMLLQDKFSPKDTNK